MKYFFRYFLVPLILFLFLFPPNPCKTNTSLMPLLILTVFIVMYHRFLNGKYFNLETIVRKKDKTWRGWVVIYAWNIFWLTYFIKIWFY